jgi:hypothetical protein
MCLGAEVDVGGEIMISLGQERPQRGSQASVVGDPVRDDLGSGQCCSYWQSHGAGQNGPVVGG